MWQKMPLKTFTFRSLNLVFNFAVEGAFWNGAAAFTIHTLQALKVSWEMKTSSNGGTINKEQRVAQKQQSGTKNDERWQGASEPLCAGAACAEITYCLFLLHRSIIVCVLINKHTSSFPHPRYCCVSCLRHTAFALCCHRPFHLVGTTSFPLLPGKHGQ